LPAPARAAHCFALRCGRPRIIDPWAAATPAAPGSSRCPRPFRRSSKWHRAYRNRPGCSSCGNSPSRRDCRCETLPRLPAAPALRLPRLSRRPARRDWIDPGRQRRRRRHADRKRQVSLLSTPRDDSRRSDARRVATHRVNERPGGCTASP